MKKLLEDETHLQSPRVKRETEKKDEELFEGYLNTIQDVHKIPTKEDCFLAGLNAGRASMLDPMMKNAMDYGKDINKLRDEEYQSKVSKLRKEIEFWIKDYKERGIDEECGCMTWFKGEIDSIFGKGE